MIEFAVFEFDQYPLSAYRTESHLHAALTRQGGTPLLGLNGLCAAEKRLNRVRVLGSWLLGPVYVEMGDPR